MRKFLFVFVIAFMLPLLAQDVQVNIYLEKPEYLLGESVTLLIEIKNNGPEVLIEGLCLECNTCQLSFHVFDSTDNEIRPDHQGNDGFALLGPKKLEKNSAFYRIAALSAIYGNNRDDFSITGNWRYFLPNKFSVNVSYKLLEYKKGEYLWDAVKGSEKVLNSNSLTFLVKEPIEVFDKAVYKQLEKIQIDKSRKPGKSKLDSFPQYNKEIQELISQYPQSAYLKIMYSSLIRNNKLQKDYKEVYRLTREFIEKFPDSWNIVSSLHYLEANCSKDNSYADKFKQMVEQFKHTRGVHVWQRSKEYMKPLDNTRNGDHNE